jgi:hypothetical protein
MSSKLLALARDAEMRELGVQRHTDDDIELRTQRIEDYRTIVEMES